MNCVKLVVDNAAAVALNQSALSDAFLVRIKAKLPRLAVVEQCENVLYFAILIGKAKTKTGVESGYYGAVRIEVWRFATLLQTDTLDEMGMTYWLEKAGTETRESAR